MSLILETIPLNSLAYEPTNMDAVNWIEKYIKLEGEPIELYDYQKDILRDKSDYRIINKSRQIGISTLIALEGLTYALGQHDTTVLMVSVADRQSKELLDKVNRAYESLPEAIKVPTKRHTKRKLEFRNGSRIISLPNNPRTVRGYKADRVYLDEFANFEKADEMWEAITPSTSRGGKVTICSTPLGKLGKFYEIWASDGAWSKHEIPWDRCPDIEKEIERIKKGMPDETQFKQEYCCEFVDESMSFFPYDLIQECVDEIEDYELNPSMLNLGVDFGKKRDSTVVVGLTRESPHEIKVLREFKGGKIATYEEPKQYLIRNIKDNWEITRVFLDDSGPGQEIIETLQKKFGTIIKPVDFTNPEKERMIWNLKHLMLDGKLKIPDDETLINQLHALRKKVTEHGNVQYVHPSSGAVTHDDYVWALALAVRDLEKKREHSSGQVYRGSALKRQNKQFSFK